MRYLITGLILTALVISCTDKFDKPDNSVAPGDIVFSDTAYIQQFPVWDYFNKPQDLIVGREPFLYVADTENDRIVMMDESGRILGIKSVKRPIALAQDFKFNLLVCAKFDTVISGSAATYNAVYKLDLASVNHQITNAKLVRILPKTTFDLLRPDREYTGVAAFYDNSFIVSRRGPSNATLVDPDNAILRYKVKTLANGSKRDTLIGKIPLFEPEGTGLRSSNKISSLTALSGNRFDFIATLIGNTSFKTQWLRYFDSEDFQGYRNNLAPFYTDIMKVNKFGKPEDVEIDKSNNIYVADAAKDSIYKFNSFGDEMESFGGSDVFSSPHSVAHFDRTLYVVDTDNNRILRFILSTDID
ncbi:MAG: hypothetical protein ABIJ40_05650 [Bacteroidota bacterium]